MEDREASQAAADDRDDLRVAGRDLASRLFVGTGKFRSGDQMRAAVEASGCSVVTVALRRVDLERPQDDMLAALEGVDAILMPNTSGARDAAEAVRLARLARAAGLPDWVKLEITPDPRYLLPDPVETLKAAEQLLADGFTVLPYINADPVLARRLAELGTATVMPLGSPIGSNQGLQTRAALRIIIEESTVPVVVDAGIGAPSHAAEAMEMGADAVLVNTAIAVAGDVRAMADAFRLAVIAGRAAFRSGLGPVRSRADASSPLTGFLGPRP